MAQSNFISINIAQNKKLLWTIAIIITLSSAIYQRMTGPTYPKRGKIEIDGKNFSYKLLRSEETNKDALISLHVPDSEIEGFVEYKRYNSNDEWSTLMLRRDGNNLVAHLPKQSPAGKLLYYVYLNKNDQVFSLTGKEPVIIRFKGSVPLIILIPHVILMFFAMLFSNRAALDALDRNGIAKKYLLITIGLFFIGGFLLGPVVQKFAFGEYWTGIPFGYDLTDNKTLLAMFGWILAWIKNRNGREGRGWIVFAAVLMLAVYLIPHSVWGSELDYTK
jgi:hypothetical protein